MNGDASNMASRMHAMLPEGWFGDVTPVLQSVLQAVGAGLSAFWMLLQSVITQTRIATATGSFLDQISQDFFGSGLPRYVDEVDDAFRTRITEALLRPRSTRAALREALYQMTGRLPRVFEPARTTDTGGYAIGGIGYGAGGGWGSLALPYQFFLTAYRPLVGGIPELAGYSGPGVPVYGSLAMEVSGIPDSVIEAAVPPLLPAATIAWMNISN
jgi:hypothetical protein